MRCRSAWPPTAAKLAAPWPYGQQRGGNGATAAATGSAPAHATAGGSGGASFAASRAGEQQSAIAAAEETASAVSAAAARLLAALFDCWSECAPATLPTGPEADALKALLEILQSAILLVQHAGLLPGSSGSGSMASSAGVVPGNDAPAGAAGWTAAQPAAQAPSSTSVDTLLDIVTRRVAPHFPCTAPAVKQPAAVQDGLIQYNLLCAQLLTSLMAAEAAAAAAVPAGAPVAAPQRPAAKQQALPWRENLLQFYIGRTHAVVEGSLNVEQRTFKMFKRQMDAEHAAWCCTGWLLRTGALCLAPPACPTSLGS